MAGANNDLHFRLFAKLLMFLTLLLGGVIGFVSGYSIGQQNAIELLYKGQQSEQTTVDSLASQSQSLVDPAVVKCYEDALGADRYEAVAGGEALTTDEVFQVLPCENLKAE